MELVLATVVNEIKTAFEKRISNEELIQILYDGVSIPSGILNRNGQPITITKSYANKLVRRLPGGNVYSDIRKHSNDSCVEDFIVKYLDDTIVAWLLPTSIGDMLQHLKTAIIEDGLIADSKKQELLSLAQEETVTEFLAGVYLYSLSRDNVKDTDVKDPLIKSKKIKNNDEKLKRTPLEKIPYSDVPAQEEHIYIDAMLQVYGQLEGKNRLSLEEIETIPEYICEFKDQRSYFYAAEAVRRGTRDVYDDADTQFTYLKDEIYEGTKEVWRQQCKNGQTRMRNVLTQACNTNLSGCLLNRETLWIGALQRKGMCHILVNEERIKGWVRDDDDDSVQQ